jgi:type I restriction enzyme S subunit
MEEWKEYKLGDVGRITTGKTPRTSISKYFDGGIHFITPADINNPYKYIYQTSRKLSPDGLESIRNNSITKGSICVSCIGNIGYVGIATMNCSSNQQINSITVNDKFDKDYVYYSIKNLWRFFKSYEGQSTTLSILNKGQFSEIKIKAPELHTQKKIAGVLSALDDKIEVNRRINDNLEQQAKALFKSWFVDFEPFREQPFVESELGMIPEGWKVDSLSSIADYINGLAMQKYRPIEGEVGLPVLKIKELGQGNTDDSSELCSPSLIGEKYIIDDGDIIFSWSGTLMVKVWCGGKCGLNQHLFAVEPKDYPHWFAYQWTKHHLDNFIHIAKDKAVTMGHIKRGELDKAKVVIPDGTSMAAIDSMMKPLHSQIISNKKESRRLAELRDTLLPRLMSGELSVDGLKGQSAVSPGQRPGAKATSPGQHPRA